MERCMQCSIVWPGCPVCPLSSVCLSCHEFFRLPYIYLHQKFVVHVPIPVPATLPFPHLSLPFVLILGYSFPFYGSPCCGDWCMPSEPELIARFTIWLYCGLLLDVVVLRQDEA